MIRILVQFYSKKYVGVTCNKLFIFPFFPHWQFQNIAVLYSGIILEPVTHVKHAS